MLVGCRNNAVVQAFACTSTPTEITSGLRFDTLSLGFHHTCGLSTTDPTVYCWGSGGTGELGNGESGFGFFTIEPQRVLGQPGGGS